MMEQTEHATGSSHLTSTGRHARPSRPFVSVVLPLRDCERFLNDQLSALADQDFSADFEIILSDDGSNDGTQQIARDWASTRQHVKVVSVPASKGANHARALGYGYASGDLILLCDGDDVVTPGWVTALVRAARRADIVGGSLAHDSLNDRELCRGIAELPGRSFGFLTYAPGGNCAVWRDVIEETGPWDASFQAGANDIEFSWRAQLKGFTIALTPDAIVHHRLRTNVWDRLLQSIQQGIGQALLYRRFSGQGMKRAAIPIALMQWTWIAAMTPVVVFSRPHRYLWIRRVGIRIGRLRGSLCYRVMFL